MQRSRSPRSAFTLLEVLMAVTVLVLALFGLLSTILSASALQRANRETTVALAAAREKVEQLQTQRIHELVAAYGPTGTTPGFAVPGLNPLSGATVGTVTILTDETITDPELGMPRDLNGDGDSTDTDVSTGRMFLLPAQITLRWQGATGERQLSVPTLVARR
jgi:type II secretory pathway pseudopilin PulG